MSTERGVEHRDGHLLETSHGGVVVRGDEVVVIVPRGSRAIGLPKGGANDGETGAETAAREVREETGIVAEHVEPLGDVRYWYRRSGRRVHKTVHFHLFRFLSGDTADHDHEVDDARWMPLAEARTALSYPGEREMIERALSKLASDR
ncbi:MAG: NUDIX domain-containing protein [Actinomycetota bacterium]|nr:NUDIX domain-containing protein [Actinomycetota bacterium]